MDMRMTFAMQALVARCRPHPQDVVIAPLDVEVMVIAQCVHDYVCPRSSVVDVAHDVQGVNRQTLYEVAHGNDEVVGPDA